MQYYINGQTMYLYHSCQLSLYRFIYMAYLTYLSNVLIFWPNGPTVSVLLLILKHRTWLSNVSFWHILYHLLGMFYSKMENISMSDNAIIMTELLNKQWNAVQRFLTMKITLQKQLLDLPYSCWWKLFDQQNYSWSKKVSETGILLICK